MFLGVVVVVLVQMGCQRVSLLCGVLLLCVHPTSCASVSLHFTCCSSAVLLCLFAVNEAQATLSLFNNYAAPAAYDTQTRIGGSIISSVSAGTAVDSHQHAALAGINKSLSHGLEAAKNLKVTI